MRRFIDRLFSLAERVNGLSVLICGAALLAMTVSVTYEVIMRYVFARPTVWSLEITTYLLVLVVFVTAGYTLQVDAHIKVDMFVMHLPERPRFILGLATSFLGLIYCTVLLWQTWEQAWRAYVLHYVSGSIIAVYLFPIYLLLPVGCFMLCLTYVTKLVGYFHASPKERSALSSGIR